MKVTFFHFRGSGSEVSKTAILFCCTLFIIVKNRPSGEKPASWATHLTSSRRTSQMSGPEEIFTIGRLPGEPSGVCRQVTGSQVVRSMMIAQATIRLISADQRLFG